MSAQLSNIPEITLPVVDMEQIDHPEIDTRTLQERLCKVMGRFVDCRFLIGTGETTTVSGILKSVGTSFFVLLDPCTNAETTCDLYSLKLLTAYPEGVPDCKMYCNRRLYNIC